MKIDAPSNDYVVMNDIQSSSRGESVKPGFTVISNYDAELCVVCAVKRYIDCVGVLQLKSTPVEPLLALIGSKHFWVNHFTMYILLLTQHRAQPLDHGDCGGCIVNTYEHSCTVDKLILNYHTSLYPPQPLLAYSSTLLFPCPLCFNYSIRYLNFTSILHCTVFHKPTMYLFTLQCPISNPHLTI